MCVTLSGSSIYWYVLTLNKGKVMVQNLLSELYLVESCWKKTISGQINHFDLVFGLRPLWRLNGWPNVKSWQQYMHRVENGLSFTYFCPTLAFQVHRIVSGRKNIEFTLNRKTWSVMIFDGLTFDLAIHNDQRFLNGFWRGFENRLQRVSCSLQWFFFSHVFLIFFFALYTSSSSAPAV